MPASPSDPDRRSAGPGGGDEGTDPGHGYPYDSLYRGASGDPAKPMRPKARHWEPSLQPPEGEHQGFGWLYREEPAPDNPPGSGDPAPPAPVLPNPAPARVRPAGSAPEPARRVGASPGNRRPRLRAGRVVLLVLVALALAAVVAVVVVAVVSDGDPGLFRSNPQPATSMAARSAAGPLSQAESGR